MTSARLLAILETRIISGPAKNLIEFVPFARKEGIETVVATFLRGENANYFTSSLESASIPVFPILEEGPFDVSTIQKLKSLIDEVKPDLVQTHAVKSHFLARLAAVPSSLPWVAFHHGYTETSWRTSLYNQFDRWSLRAASQVVTVSHASLGQLKSKGVDTRKVRVVHNAMPHDSDATTSDPDQIAALRASLGIPVGQKVILSVGRLSKEKDHVGLLEAVASLPADLAPHLVIVGDGPKKEAIAEKARALGLTNRITLTGMQDRTSQFYELADVVVISSRTEGSPNVLLETLAAGVPLVATAVGGIPEMVTNGEQALLVQHGNTDQMATSIARMLTDVDLARGLVQRGRNLVRTRFSPAQRAQTLANMYKEILELSGPSRIVERSF